jgi:hypothetical protein
MTRIQVRKVSSFQKRIDQIMKLSAKISNNTKLNSMFTDFASLLHADDWLLLFELRDDLGGILGQVPQYLLWSRYDQS